MDMVGRIQILAVILLVANCAAAATYTVRKDGTGDFTVIQDALDATADGDSVLIGPGRYTESSMVRLSGYGYDIESFGRISSSDLTVIGSGVELTIIGPSAYEGSPGTLSPKCLAYDVGGGTLQISDLTVQNCYDGFYVIGRLQMDRCRALDCGIGLSWARVGSGGWVKDSRFEVAGPLLSPMSFAIGALGGGSNITLEDCHVGNGSIIDGVQGMVVRNCDLNGLSLYSGTHTYIHNCRALTSNAGVSMSLGGGSVCEIQDSAFTGLYAALNVSEWAPGSRFVVENTRLEGGAHGVLFSGSSAGPCIIHNCDLVKGSGPMVECATSAALVTHDMADNYWGTTDEATIQSWIIDHGDNPSIGATVIYSPFAGQSVPTESTSWGDLKALWR